MGASPVSPVFIIINTHPHQQQRYPIMSCGSNSNPISSRSSKPTILLNANIEKKNNNMMIIPFPSKSKSNTGTTDYCCYSKRRRRSVAASAAAVVDMLLSEVVSSAAAADPSSQIISWQIVVGALAGVTPFVVAGIEFGKRINAQRKCKTCSGSGLVLRDNKYYFRCPSCGGFLPWQSWTRFFTG